MRAFLIGALLGAAGRVLVVLWIYHPQLGRTPLAEPVVFSLWVGASYGLYAGAVVTLWRRPAWGAIAGAILFFIPVEWLLFDAKGCFDEVLRALVFEENAKPLLGLLLHYLLPMAVTGAIAGAVGARVRQRSRARTEHPVR
jgi:hypothetical protein